MTHTVPCHKPSGARAKRPHSFHGYPGGERGVPRHNHVPEACFLAAGDLWQKDGLRRKAGGSLLLFAPHRTCLACGSLWCSWPLQRWLCICYLTCDRRIQNTATWSDGRPGPGQRADSQRPPPSSLGGTHCARAPTPPMCPYLLCLSHSDWKGL